MFLAASRTVDRLETEIGDPMRDLTGTTLGHYEVQERLGVGGMAEVYRAIQTSLGREVALKVLTPSLVEDETFLKRFENEARTLASLDHPNILPIFDFDRTDGVAFLTMPIVRGGSLKDLLDKGRLDVPTTWRYLQQITDALQHAHDAGIVHRDLKPANVMLHSDGRALLADFGLARTGGGNLALTTVGFTVGTPGYMAPEQAMGRELDSRADIYSLAVMVFEMLTGEPPYLGTTPMELVVQTISGPIPKATTRNANLPDELDGVLARGLAKDPKDRPESARAFLALLGKVPVGRTAAVVPAGPSGPPVATLTPPPAAAPEAAAPAAASGSPALTPSPPSMEAIKASFSALTFGHMEAAVNAAPPAAAGSAIATLELQGIGRLVARQRFSLNSHFANTVHCAREISGARWPEVASTAQLTEYLVEDPISNEERTTPIESLSKLNEAFEIVFGADAPDRIRHWGRLGTDRSLSLRASNTEKQAFKLIPGQQRKLDILLKSFTKSMDDVRGEHLHTYKKIDENQFWLVHFSNLYALGRRKPDKACHVWTSSFESMLRWAGLANDWLVTEIECGCVTGTWDCVFAIRSVKR